MISFTINVKNEIASFDSVKDENSKIILTSPRGKKFNQRKALELKNESHLIID